MNVLFFHVESRFYNDSSDVSLLYIVNQSLTLNVEDREGVEILNEKTKTDLP